MAFVINATDTSGQISLRRDTAAAAIKKASELIAESCWNVRITAPDGHEYPASDFDRLARLQAQA